jgi:hypothetical protein
MRSGYNWRKRFSADPNLIGQSITLTEESYTVVGVMPAKFEFPKGVDLWLPIRTVMDLYIPAASLALTPLLTEGHPGQWQMKNDKWKMENGARGRLPPLRRTCPGVEARRRD